MRRVSHRIPYLHRRNAGGTIQPPESLAGRPAAHKIAAQGARNIAVMILTSLPHAALQRLSFSRSVCRGFGSFCEPCRPTWCGTRARCIAGAANAMEEGIRGWAAAPAHGFANGWPASPRRQVRCQRARLLIGQVGGGAETATGVCCTWHRLISAATLVMKLPATMWGKAVGPRAARAVGDGAGRLTSTHAAETPSVQLQQHAHHS